MSDLKNFDLTAIQWLPSILFSVDVIVLLGAIRNITKMSYHKKS